MILVMNRQGVHVTARFYQLAAIERQADRHDSARQCGQYEQMSNQR